MDFDTYWLLFIALVFGLGEKLPPSRRYYMNYVALGVCFAAGVLDMSTYGIPLIAAVLWLQFITYFGGRFVRPARQAGFFLLSVWLLVAPFHAPPSSLRLFFFSTLHLMLVVGMEILVYRGLSGTRRRWEVMSLVLAALWFIVVWRLWPRIDLYTALLFWLIIFIVGRLVLFHQRGYLPLPLAGFYGLVLVVEIALFRCLDTLPPQFLVVIPGVILLSVAFMAKHFALAFSSLFLGQILTWLWTSPQLPPEWAFPLGAGILFAVIVSLSGMAENDSTKPLTFNALQGLGRQRPRVGAALMILQAAFAVLPSFRLTCANYWFPYEWYVIGQLLWLLKLGMCLYRQPSENRARILRPSLSVWILTVGLLLFIGAFTASRLLQWMGLFN